MNWAWVTAGSLSRLPSAATSTARYASTISCTSTAESVALLESGAIAELIVARLPEVTPVTLIRVKLSTVGAVLVPVYAAMIASAWASWADTEVATTEESSAKVSIPEPLSAVAAIAARTPARFEAFTPGMPKAAKSAAVSAGETGLPAAAAIRRSTIEASATSSSLVSICETFRVSATKLIRSASDVELIDVTPRIWNWAAVRVPPVPATPSAAARRMLYASTMACTSARVSVSPALSGPITELMAPRLPASTPVTPAFA